MDTQRDRTGLGQATLLALLAVAAYHRLPWNGFVNLDDPSYLTRNPVVARGLTLDGAWWALTTFHSYNWHPLTWLSHMLDVELWGLAPGAHHATSALLHAANVVLLYLWLRRATGAAWRSAAVAALFAVHPIHVESVAWAAERKDVLSGTFFMLTLLAWTSSAPRAARWASSLACFAAGLMSKPMLVSVPVVLLLLDFWPLARARSSAPAADGDPKRPEGRSWRALLWEKAPFFALAGASSAVTLLAQNAGGRGAIVYESAPALNAGNALLSYARYLGKAAWPVDLAVIYPFHAEDVTATRVGAAVALLLAVTVVAVAVRRRRPYVLFGWLWFLVALLPVIGFLRIGWHAMADRYAYLPSIGLYVAAVWTTADVAARLAAPRVVTGAIAAVVLGILAALTAHQQGYWRSSVPLFEHAVAVTSDNALAHINLGAAYGELHDPRAKTEALFGRLLEAREIVALHPASADAYFRLGNAFADLDRQPDAIRAFEQALALRPDFPRARNNLGVARASQGALEDAAREFREAVRLDPGYAEASDNLAVIGRMIDARSRR
jgi:tetratricopeptide (TPR) repeat protein